MNIARTIRTVLVLAASLSGVAALPAFAAEPDIREVQLAPAGLHRLTFSDGRQVRCAGPVVRRDRVVLCRMNGRLVSLPGIRLVKVEPERAAPAPRRTPTPAAAPAPARRAVTAPISFTNDDLPESAEPAPSAPAPTAARPVPGTITNDDLPPAPEPVAPAEPVAPSVTPPAGSAPPADDPGGTTQLDRDGHGKDWWMARRIRLEALHAEAEKRMRDADLRVAQIDLRQRYANEDATRAETEDVEAVKRQGKLDYAEAKQRADELRALIDGLPEDARRAGAPAEWVTVPRTALDQPTP